MYAINVTCTLHIMKVLVPAKYLFQLMLKSEPRVLSQYFSKFLILVTMTMTKKSTQEDKTRYFWIILAADFNSKVMCVIYESTEYN